MKEEQTREELASQGAVFTSFGHEKEYVAAVRAGTRTVLYVRHRGNTYRSLAY